MFVFVPEQGAALLEDLAAEVTGVDAVLPLPLLGERSRIRVVLLLQRGKLGAAVLLCLLLEMEGERRLATR